MDYVITSSGRLIPVNALCHHGIKGQKWGVRRYQNPDGSLTPAGKKRRVQNGDRTKWGVKKSEYKTMNREQRNKLKRDYFSTEEGKNDNKRITRNTVVGTLLGGPVIGLAVGFATLKKVSDNVPVRDDRGAKVCDEAVTKIGGTKVSDLNSKNASTFKTNRWGEYSCETKIKLGRDNDVECDIQSKPGREASDMTTANKFLKRYNSDFAREAIAKEYYDGKDSWVSKDPSGDNYYTRTDFKNKLKPEHITIDPEWDTYTVTWYDGGTYGGHFFVDEGSLSDMKVRRRSLEG